MRIAVVGGAGFVGRHLCLALLRAGHEIVVLDNLHAIPETAWLLPGQLAQLDIRDQNALDFHLGSFRPDLIYHLAALHYIPYCDQHPEETLQVNVTGTLNLMLATGKLPGLRGLVFASSVAVYPANDDYHVEAGPTQPCDIYGLSKSLAEQIVDFYARRLGISHLTARFANVYGPHETNPHVIPVILDQLLNGADTLRLGRTDCCRDFLYVEDLADGLTAAMPLLFRPAMHETVNFGPGKESTVQEAIDILCNLSGRSVRCITDPARLRPVERMHLRAQINRARELLGWTPRHELPAGLAKTFAWAQAEPRPRLAACGRA